MNFRRVLAVETSCDDTSVAIVRENGFVEICLAQDQDVQHKPFGGVVPEIASRNHTQNLLPLVERAMATADRNWSDIDGLVVTNRPGLLGALMVGVVTVKSLALSLGKPFIGVNHLEGHILAPLLHDETLAAQDFAFPFLTLAASGGHSTFYDVRELGQYHVLGTTIDDAAGEAFDKFAKMVGLGFPGGAQVDRLAKQGRMDRFQFPRPMMKKGKSHRAPKAPRGASEMENMSFSGLKTAARVELEKIQRSESTGVAKADMGNADLENADAGNTGQDGSALSKETLADLCASFQEAIVDVLIAKLDRLVEKTGHERVTITGGVSANHRLRERVEDWSQRKGVQTLMPPLRYCTDNAAMIGYAGILRLNRGEQDSLDLGPLARSQPEDFLFPERET